MRTILVVLLIATSGCSLTFQSKPGSGVAKSTSCTASSGYWIADAAGASLLPIGLATAIVRRDGDTDAERSAYGVALFTGLLYLASMGNGIRWTRECRALQRESAASVARAD